MCSVRSRVIGR